MASTRCVSNATLAEYIKVPFVDYGRDREGWDCWGLVVAFYREHFEIVLNDHPVDPRQRHEVAKRVLEETTAHWWSEVEHEDVEGGEVVVFSFRGNECHVGVMLNREEFLSCGRAPGTHIAPIAETRWWQRVEGFYRHGYIGHG